ncbi:MAG: B12-binding domain-containing radical SAM protein [Spirochaetaceae bacterium]|nr:B12-binding domain-containing radical SAM protein [Spirochaetaceae bacterium]
MANIYFINPPFKAEYGKFSREQRSPAITKSGALYYPLWLIYAAVLAEKNGHSVCFLDAPAKPLDTSEALLEVRQEVAKLNTERLLFVLDTSTPSIKNDVSFGAELKKEFPASFVVLVGTHPSAVPEETLAMNTAIDAVTIAEFDKTISELANELDKTDDWSVFKGENLKGILFQHGSRTITHNSYMENLDELPFASAFIKKYLDVHDYFFPASVYPSIQIFTGRGCPAHCTFCVYPQTMHGHTYRVRSPENVAAEFQYIADNFPEVKEVVIEDDTFTINKERTVAVCKLLIEKGLNKRLKWLCNARVNLDLETMKIMRKAGCRLIIPGIESGNQQILNNIKKGTKVEQFYDYVRNAKKAGLLIHACYMVGNQGETRETMEETLRLALKLNTDTAQFFPMIPYPGTEAYNWAKQNGYIEADYTKYCKEDGEHNTVLNLPGLSAEDIVSFCDMARKKYYLRPRYILHRLRMGLTDINDLKRSLKAFMHIKKYLFRTMPSN